MAKERKVKEKPKYTAYQVVRKMIHIAWKEQKSVILIGLVLILLTAMQRIFELLVSPMILSAIETKAGIVRLLLTILLFAGGILITSSLKAYFDLNSEYGRNLLMMRLLKKAGDKYVKTSYSNIITAEFEEKSNIAFNAVFFQETYAFTIWIDLINICWNMIGLILFGFVLSSFHFGIMLLILGLSVIGWVLRERFEFITDDHMDEIRHCFRESWYVVHAMYDPELGKDIRIFHMQQWIRDIYQGILNTMWTWYKRRETRWFWLDMIDVMVAFLRNGIGYFFLIRAALAQTITLPEFLLYTAAVGGFTSWVQGILSGVHAVHKQAFSLSAYFEYLDAPEPFRFENGKPIPEPSENGYEISLEHVSFRYPDSETDALTDINLTLRPFEKLAVVGLNGAGKTTLVNLMLGLLDPSEGCVRLNGIDIREFNRQEYYELFSAVFQSFEAMRAPIRANVSFSTEEVDEKKIWNVLKQTQLKDKIESLPNGLETFVGLPEEYYDVLTFNGDPSTIARGTKFSGGELQRLMLARALYKNGPILMLDEPTAALDPIAEDAVYQEYNKIAEGKSAVFISHRLASTLFCDQIIYMEKGHIKEQGTHEELLEKQGGYAKLFEVQSRYYQDEQEVNPDDI